MGEYSERVEKYSAAQRRVGVSHIGLDLQVNMHNRIFKQAIL